MSNFAVSSNASSQRRPADLHGSYLSAPKTARALPVSAQARNAGVADGRRLRFVAVGLLVLAITLFGQSLQWPAASANDESVSVSISYVTVRAGDTLWGLAEKYAPNTDPQDWISKVAQINNLTDASVQAGQRLAIPGK